MDFMVEQLNEANLRQQRSDEARREFLAAAGHDLRTPLTSLRAAVEALEDGLAPDPDRYLKSIVKDLNALQVLIDDLFELARLEAGELPTDTREIDLSVLASDVAQAMEPLAEAHGVSMHVEGSARIPVSESGMLRVFRNLLDNAVRHSPAGGTVSVRVRRDGSTVTVTVSDEGPGFPDGFRERAFESFTRADPARRRGGTGLGLAITRAIVAAHGGVIEIDETGGGSVTFRIPCAMGTGGPDRASDAEYR